MNKFLVVGSINTDLVSRVSRFLKAGETMKSDSFFTAFGGKGANQAVALSKLGADTTMLGKIGNDSFGDNYIDNFKKNNVNVDYIKKDGDTTGTAIITVDSVGANQIIIVPGANGKVDKSYIDENIKAFDKAKIALFQLEIPLETIIYALKKAKEHGIITVLDPAPAVKLPEEIYNYVDYITPNETETEILTGLDIDSNSVESIRRAADVLLQKGAKNIIIKAGKKGAYYINKSSMKFAKSYDVKTVDTTAAGDSFNAGFSFAIGNDKSIDEAMLSGCAVASLSTTGVGAQSAMPTISELITLMKSQDIKVESL